MKVSLVILLARKVVKPTSAFVGFLAALEIHRYILYLELELCVTVDSTE